jgi:aspartyl-tRNA(Asn)/glutamyl-tRNA(Gln) amidotransferase subunit B
MKKELPEMPSAKLDKLLKKFKLEKSDAEILVKNLELVDFAEGLDKAGVKVKENISWITIELLRVLNYNKKTLEDADVEIKPEHLAELISLVDKGELTVLKAKQIMNDFVPKSFSVKEKLSGAIGKLSDDETKKLVEQAIKENPKIKDVNFLMGQVMRLSARRADPNVVRKVLGEMLG